MSILDVTQKQRENRIVKLINALIRIILSIGLVECSNPEIKSSGAGRIDPSAYAADNMTFDKPRVVREPNSFNFYYKHCQIEDRMPPPKGANWECTEP